MSIKWPNGPSEANINRHTIYKKISIKWPNGPNEYIIPHYVIFFLNKKREILNENFPSFIIIFKVSVLTILIFKISALKYL